ncbi:MAG: hypothetical protein N2517_01900 [Ignavibacteria bacterium]|nr:hypothetical protein [Ignavibacteria bacterium]
MSKLIIFLCFILSSVNTYSQIEDIPSPLGPGKGPKQTELGITFGFGTNWQTGEFIASCECPNFRKGIGNITSFGIIFQRDLNRYFQIGGTLQTTLLNNTASYKQRELLSFTSQTGEKFSNVPVLFRQKLEINFNFLIFSPFINFAPLEFLHFRLGPAVSIPLTTKLVHSKELLQKTVRLENGELVELSLENSNQAVIENGKVPLQENFLIGLIYSIVGNFHIYQNFFGGVNLSFYHPLTNYTNRGIDYKLNSWTISLELRYALQMREWKGKNLNN